MSVILQLVNVDLACDVEACWIIKNETVSVEFAEVDGELQSAVGINRYSRGDALVTGSTGDRWCVSRARFDAKHQSVEGRPSGQNGRYCNIPRPIRGKCMGMPFSVARCADGDVLQGVAGDWLVEYGPGDHGIVARGRFAQVYREVQPAR
jgi:PGDYG protein